MRFVFAANEKMKKQAVCLLASLNRLGYQWSAFDLGGLGFGTPFKAPESLAKRGSYETGFSRWRSTGMHVPAMMLQALQASRAGDVLTYTDCDVIVRQRIDEIEGVPFDIGVCLRKPEELPPEVRGFPSRTNSGVMFFRKTEATLRSVEAWIHAAEAVGSNQEAMNSIYQHLNCAVHEFDGRIYNWYDFDDEPPATAKVLHFKGGKAFNYFGFSNAQS